MLSASLDLGDPLTREAACVNGSGLGRPAMPLGPFIRSAERQPSRFPDRYLPSTDGEGKVPGMADAAEFDEFVHARSPRLLRVAYLLTRDWALAEDLLQTALARSWSAWRRIEGDPEPFVRKVLVNTYSSWWRRRWHGERPTGDLPDHPSASAEHDAIDARDQVWRALGRLPRRQRAVIVLRYFEDLPEAEVAQILGVTPGIVKSQTHKALSRLRLDHTLEGANR